MEHPFWRDKGRSLIKTRNKTGPRTVPWGIPDLGVCHLQCCQVPVFVRIFTEIRPVIRSTEMQWSIPQIWKNQNRFRKVSISNKFQFQIDYAPRLGDRSVDQLNCCWPTLALDTSWNSILPYFLSTRLATCTLSFSSYTSIINQVLLVPSSLSSHHHHLLLLLHHVLYCKKFPSGI